jgi:hypothetical protein
MLLLLAVDHTAAFADPIPARITARAMRGVL